MIALEPSNTVAVHGGRKLNGSVDVGGFKHSLVTVAAAAHLGHAPVIISNAPAIRETAVLAQLLANAGANVIRRDGTLIVDAPDVVSHGIDVALANRIHGSAYLVPGFLAKTGHAILAIDGGCRIGTDEMGRRPFEHYLDLIERFGGRVIERTDSSIACHASALRGCDVDLLDFTSDRSLQSGPLYSGASKMAVPLAAVSHGRSVIRHPYPKTDLLDLVVVLREMGADVDEHGDSIVIMGRGHEVLTKPVHHILVPDLIEIVTWIAAGVLLAESPLTVQAARMAAAIRGLAPELDILAAMGVNFETGPAHLVVPPTDQYIANDIVVSSPGIYSDSHPFLALLLTKAAGASTITETVWSNRFGYAIGLQALGVRLSINGSSVTLAGSSPPRLGGQEVVAGDLRAAAVLLLAALMIGGTTVIHGVDHLRRGYADLIPRLRSLGADIEYTGDAP